MRELHTYLFPMGSFSQQTAWTKVIPAVIVLKFEFAVSDQGAKIMLGVSM